MKKENYTMVIVKTEDQNMHKQSWDTFYREMKHEGFEEAIIIPTDKAATDVNLAKRIMIGLLMKNNAVKYSADYAVIDHSDNNRLLPCIVLYDPELKFAAVSALQMNPDKYFIQAIIPHNSNELHINKCSVTEYDEGFNDKAN